MARSLPSSLRAFALAALLALALAGSAKAERPGWYSSPSIVSGSAKVGSTLAGSDGGLHCEPACTAAGPSPERPGIFLEWLSCTGPSGGGSDRPAGGLPDDPRPAPGCVSRGAPAKGATTYTVRAEDGGRWIQLHVLATSYDCGEVVKEGPDAGKQECNYSSANGYSATIGPVEGGAIAPPTAAGAPGMTAYPTTTGLAREGQTLTAATGSWTASPTRYTYQWKRCAPEFEPCTPIAGATARTYVLTKDDVGWRVQVLVAASNSKGSNSAASFPTEIVETSAVTPVNTVLPAVAGTVEERQTLTASTGTWTGSDTFEYAYQWQRCSTKLGGCAAIEGATARTYRVVRDDLAARLQVAVTATNRAGSSDAVSAPTEHVAPAQPRPGADRLPVAELAPGNGLVVAGARLASATVAPGAAIALTVEVTDRRGFLIGGARVTVTGPRGSIVRGVTTATRADGRAVVRLRAGAKLPQRGKLVLTISVASPDAAVTATRRVATRIRPR